MINVGADGLSLADLLRHFRSHARLSQEGLAERAGISTRTVSDIECGVARYPRAITVSLLAEALDLDPDARDKLRAAARRAPQSDAPARAPAAQRAALPAIVGRGREIAALRALLADPDARLVTVLGGPGVGKSIVAAHVAAAHAAAVDEVVAVDLAAIPDPAFVPTKLALALGVGKVSSRPLADLQAGVGDRRVFFVLDTFEHVAAAAGFIADMLAAIPTAQALVTSRVPLRISAEREFPLEELAVPAATTASRETLETIPSVALLVARARTVKPGFALTDDNASAIRDLARRLEGLPLAIELAAPLLKMFSPAGLATRLERRLPLLVGGHDDAPARQRTMRDAIAWSYELLGAPEKRLFRQLSVFRAAFSPEAATAIAGERDEAALVTLRSLAALVEQNLVRVDDVDGLPRFRLSELVREYAFDRLVESGEVDEVMTRLAEHCMAEANVALVETDRREPLERLEAAAPTFDVVFDWARTTHRADLGLRVAHALWNFWWASGSAAIGMSWLRPLVDMVERGVAEVDERTLADAYREMSGLSESLGEFVEAAGFAERSLALNRKLGDAASIASALNGMGVGASESGDYARADELFQETLAIRRELGNPYLIACTLCDIGQNAANGGDYASALRHVGEGMSLFRQIDSSIGISVALAVLSLISVRSGDYHGAESFARQCIRINEERLAFVASRALANVCLARIALARANCDEAAARLDEALAMYEDVNDAAGIASTFDVMGELAHRVGHNRDAARLLGAAAGMRERQNQQIVRAERVAYDALVEGVRAALGAVPFDAEWLIGRAVPLNELRAQREQRAV